MGPIRAIDGFTRILADECGEQFGPEARRLLDLVAANSSRLRMLSDATASLLAASAAELHPEALNMTEIARDVVRQHGPAAEAGATTTIQPLPGAWGDRALIRRLWANLVDNAFKFTRRVGSGQIEIGAQQTGDDAVYYVKDSGIGFEMRYAPEIFEPFRRLLGEGDYPGAGMGLAIARCVVERHRGRIWAEARRDAGAKFSFTLGPRA